jgi:hypothetical protein
MKNWKNKGTTENVSKNRRQNNRIKIIMQIGYVKELEGGMVGKEK